MLPGAVIADRYEILRGVAQGGMASVYEARDHASDGQSVAVKVIRGVRADDVARFVREARILAGLRHPGIVHHVDDGRLASGETYLVMEWLDGEDLSSRLARGPLPIGEAVLLVRRAAEALGVAHQAGLIHRDIKPHNLFLVGGATDAVKVLDFGLARFLDATHILTQTGTILGTPGYMAPEQARDEEVDARADVFALGCVLFECLTGRQAFSADRLWAVLTKVLFEEVPPASKLRPEVPARLDAVLARLLSKDRERRPEDGRQVAALLADGLPLDPRPPPAARDALSGEEQRIVSIIVCAGEAPRDPGLAERAQTVRIVTEEQDAGATPLLLADAAALHGATVEHLADGTIVAVLQGDGPATDLAARAARCALALRRVRGPAPMAVATGRGMVSGGWPVGEVVDRAAQLLRDAPLKAVRLDSVTSDLLDARFEVDGGGDLLEEHEPVAGSRTLLGKPTPFVGRERELVTLEAFHAECIGEQVTRAVILIGPPGIGKSRLRYELMRRLEGRSRIWIARADPMRAGSPFGMAGAIVRQGCGLPEAMLRPERLAARVGELGLPLRVAEFLGEMAGLPFSDESIELRGARRDALLMAEQIRIAFVEWLTAEAEEGPLVVVLEDLHWGDLPTVKLVETAIREVRDRPLFILGTARPEVRDHFPRLYAEGLMHVVHLGQLPRRAAERLIRDVLGRRTAEATVERIIERAEGNAFFLEELIRAAAGGSTDLPESVLAMVQLRVASMEDEARQVLRAASVFGQVFWLGGVTALVPPGPGLRVAEWARVLVDREVASRRQTSRFPGDEELVFRHAIVREAAYATLTDDDRIIGHRLAAAWLEAAGEPDAASLAEHWERGREPARAALQYRRAAERALDGDDLEAAAALAARGVACGAAGVDLGALLLLQAEANCWRAELSAAAEQAALALEELPWRGDDWYHALELAAHIAGVSGASQRLDELATILGDVDERAGGPALRAAAVIGTRLVLEGRAEPAGAIARRFAPALERVRVAEPAAAAHLLKLQSFLAAAEGDYGAELELAEQSRAAFERAGGQRAACFQQVNVGEAQLRLGGYARAEQLFREALETARRLGLTAVVAWIQQNLGVTLGVLGRLDDARGTEAASAHTYQLIGERPMEAASRAHLSTILLAAGDLAAAEAEARRAAELAAEPTLLLPRRALALAALANALHASGRDARAAAQEAVDMLERMKGAHENETFIRLAYLECAPEAGPATRAWLLARADLIRDPAMRRQFLEAIPASARILELTAT